METIWAWESLVRLGCFAGVLLLMAAWEICAPRRQPRPEKGLRWANNLGLVILNTVLARVIAPLGAVGMAWQAQKSDWGLFNQSSLPPWAAFVLSLVVLDFAIYLQHVLFHSVPLLWRLHMVHHADRDVDTSTGLRFHTIEILLSLGIKMALVALLGAPPMAVLVFEVVLNASSLFNHGNARLPRLLDRFLRCFVVTPDMHRVHHSILPRETNSNFGFNLSWWDYLFGTYRSEPAAGHEKMTLGLSHLRDDKVQRLPWMLGLPFLSPTGNYPITEEHTSSPATQAQQIPRP